ncbi:MAG: 16S rRNA (cytidine(1402)-2'-O)-methyltransferase [Deltaproteobacteria bacterium GWC2_56_8]|nr:MAG: 16S rRNA (cytidine(1402)-2'-O)-methyltransferase [Deltaproteobacteria bacterium GWB2_55_19]OGP33705.1 MAG: 16S rRNA (cytidine(1402)-2'-O)-methyltransferase [Deltaproteobacteria bacterium GWC2_56_8]
MGTLFVVSTPIGNLEDITLRALRVLKEVGLIAAEDTRHTKKLLAHYGIGTPLTSYHEHNEREKAKELSGKLMDGVDIALVTDAGTPGISDPGYRLIRLAIVNSVPVVSIPGPSAIMAALSVSGLPLNEFTFKGFAPSGEARRAFFLEMKGTGRTYAFYESPGRLKDTLQDMAALMPGADVSIAREMTKLHEEVIRGGATEVLDALADREIRGEVVVVLHAREERIREADMASEIESLLKEGFRLNDVVKAVAKESGMPRAQVYKEALRVQDTLKGEGK